MPGPFTYPVAVSVPFDGTEDSDGVLVDPPFVSSNVRDAIIEARETAPGRLSRFVALSSKTGNIKNAWLEFFDSIASNTVPFVIAESGYIKAFSVCNTLSVTNAKIKVFINGTSVYIFQWTGKSHFINGLNIALNPGDKLSVKVGSKQLKNPIFNTFIQVNTNE